MCSVLMWNEVQIWVDMAEGVMWGEVVMCGALGMYGFSGVGVQWKCG